LTDLLGEAPLWYSLENGRDKASRYLDYDARTLELLAAVVASDLNMAFAKGYQIAIGEMAKVIDGPSEAMRRLQKLEALDSAVTKRHAMWAKETDKKYAGYRSVALTEFRELRGEQERQLKVG
jgi:hypothetical protein